MTIEVLTVAKAKYLKGKTIEWTHYGYPMNSNKIEKMVVGEIITEWEWAERQPCEGYSNKADYWNKIMSEAQIHDSKNRLVLLNEKGENTYIYCDTTDNYFGEPTFVCSDSDRAVFFSVCE